MQRLTERAGKGIRVIQAANQKSTTVDYKAKSPNEIIADALTKLADYEDAEEEGRLVYLPVKLGNYAYIPMGGKIYRNKVLSYFISDDSFLVCVEYHPNEASSSGQWLKASNVFARSEEAEAKLKKMEDNK